LQFEALTNKEDWKRTENQPFDVVERDTVAHHEGEHYLKSENVLPVSHFGENHASGRKIDDRNRGY
jgi:hypothetical protein